MIHPIHSMSSWKTDLLLINPYSCEMFDQVDQRVETICKRFRFCGNRVLDSSVPEMQVGVIRLCASCLIMNHSKITLLYLIKYVCILSLATAAFNFILTVWGIIAKARVWGEGKFREDVWRRNTFLAVNGLWGILCKEIITLSETWTINTELLQVVSRTAWKKLTLLISPQTPITCEEIKESEKPN